MRNGSVKPYPTSPAHDALGLALLLSAGLLTRLVFVWTFPTEPVSDFRSLVDFGIWMRDRGITAGGFYWDLLSPGLPLTLSLLFRVFPDSPDSAARLATAVATGILPALPFALWRGVQPFRVRLLAGGLLALWPGQIVFSGVVAQDNWVVLPAVALAALAVRTLSAGPTGRGHALAAGLLYACGVSIRQEMLVVLVPLLAVAAGFWPRRGQPWRRPLLVCALAAGVPLFLMAWQRQAATGRFALTSEHSGAAILGSYVPGATANAWADPLPYIAAVEPALLEDHPELKRRAAGLAMREAAARPAFHAARITLFTLNFAVGGEAANLVWSVGPDQLPPSHADRAAAFGRAAARWLPVTQSALLALFLASLLLARRSPAVWVLTAAMALKIGLHAVTVAQGRYFLCVTALQILVIALAAGAVGRPSPRRTAAALAVGGLAATALYFAAPLGVAWVRARDVDVQRTYRFRMAPDPMQPMLFDCVVRRGRLTQVSKTSARIETLHPFPPPGESAAAECVASSPASLPPLAIRLNDPYAPGGSPGRMVQRVVVDGREVHVHDMAGQPGSGWSEIPVRPARTGGRTSIVVEVAAVQPDSWMSWGSAAGTSFELIYLRENG